MLNRRMRPFTILESPGAIRVITTIYLSAGVILLASVIYFSSISESIATIGSSFLPSLVLKYFLPVLAIAYLSGLLTIYLLKRKCLRCVNICGQRITTAMEKMSKGDLGWKIVLRHGDEMADVAQSISSASQSLAERIGRIKVRTRELTEVEDFLLDSIGSDRSVNNYTMNALRQLKICTSRLSADIDGFQLSLITAKPVSEEKEFAVKV